MWARCVALLALPLASAYPEQVHISLTGKTGEMAVDFVTTTNVGSNNSVHYGLSPTQLTSVATAYTNSFTGNGWHAFMNQALMVKLAANTTYYYSCEANKEGSSQIFKFVNQPMRENGNIYAVYADMGYENDESLPFLITDAMNGGFDVIIHAGDFAYDFDTANSTWGNGYMMGIQPYAAEHPYMASPGNHEAYETQGGSLFSQFVNRFRALETYAGANSGSASNLWYSWDNDLIHWVAFTSETWTMTPAQITAEVAWLKADLAKANANRANVPWVIAYSHKNWDHDQVDWNSTGIADALHVGGVDVFLCGHWHEYFRYFPVTTAGGKMHVDRASVSSDNATYVDPLYQVAFVIGAPGDIEVNPTSCVLETDRHPTCSSNYGYGKLVVHNATTMSWTWMTTVPVQGGKFPDYADAAVIVQHNHGPRAMPTVA